MLCTLPSSAAAGRSSQPGDSRPGAFCQLYEEKYANSGAGLWLLYQSSSFEHSKSGAPATVRAQFALVT